MPEPSTPVRVLSIDGGGIRGLLPAIVLAEIEARTQRPLSELFDLVVGTSTGGIIGIGLAHGLSAAELAEFYPKFGRRIFGGASERPGWQKRLFGSEDLFGASMRKTADKLGAPFGRPDKWNGNARHSPAGLESVLNEVMGQARLSEARTELAVTTFDGLSSCPVVLTSRDARIRSDHDLLLADVARATSAAPTFFPPHEINWAGARRRFVDGGVWANNPAAVALTESLHLTGERGMTGASVFLLSLGTGASTTAETFAATGSWLGAGAGIFGVATSVMAGEVIAKRSLAAGNYYRFQVIDDRIAGAMDDPSASRLQALASAAERMIRDSSTAIDLVVQQILH